MGSKLVLFFLLNINVIYNEALQGRQNKYSPIVLILQPDESLEVNALPGDVIDDHAAGDHRLEEDVVPDEKTAYLLYHVFKVIQDTEQLDSDVDEKFEKTKHVLRQALRYRCNQLSNCVNECPQKPKKVCKKKCQKKIDVLDVCDDSIKKKRGKTLPPYWR